MLKHLPSFMFFLFLFFFLQSFVNTNGVPPSFLLIADGNESTSIEITDSVYNRYSPDGNISILLAVDSHLIGAENFFSDKADAQKVFNNWLIPFEKRFNISFHVLKVKTFTPGENDSLDTSIVKVAEELSWTFAETQEDPLVDGNNYDFLIIYQENYKGGRNRANSVNGNALIIAHNQPFDWTTRQLILLHEVGHIFGGEHLNEGVIPPEWFGSSEMSLMSYENLSYMSIFGWNRDKIPFDDHNFEIINSSKYRFDRNDADLDTLPNYYEFRYGMDPTSDDTLQDLEDDGVTNIDEYFSGTNPIVSDTDGDLFSDWAELFFGSSPLNISDLPVINEPVIFPLSEDQTILDNQTAEIKWRSVAQNKDTYSIYSNETLLTQENWNQEIIQFTFNPQHAGIWEITCVVEDEQGLTAQSSVWITVQREGNPKITSFFVPWLSLVILLLISKFRSRKQ